MADDDGRRMISVSEAVAAVATALSGVGMSISLAALIFTGPLADGLPRGIGGFIVGSAILSMYIGWRSRFVPVVGLVQDAPAVVMVAVAAGVAAGGSEQPVVAVFVLIAIATLITSALMFLVGQFRLGNLVRFIPNTVVAAFIAGTGYLLLKGGLDVMVGFVIDADTVADLFTADVIWLWLPGAVFGVSIWFVGRSTRLPPAAMSLSVVAVALGFYLVVLLWSSVDAVERAAG